LHRKIGELQERLRMQELLVCDIDHRTKNAFQLASSVLSLKAKRTEAPEVRQALKDAAHQLVSFSAAHALLTAGDDHVDIQRYLSLLANALADENGLVAIRLHAGPAFWRLHKALPLGLLASELMINALKHAFPNGRRGEIFVNLTSNASDIVFSVADNGIGWYDDRRLGSGSDLIHRLAKQIGGELEAVSTPERSSQVRLIIDRDRFEGLVAGH
jgi:two-component sensor histidine kinase